MVLNSQDLASLVLPKILIDLERSRLFSAVKFFSKSSLAKDLVRSGIILPVLNGQD